MAYAEEMEMLEFETFILPMEDGTDQEFAIMDEFEFEENSYIVVSAVNGDVVEDDIYLYRYREDGEDIIVDYIEDEDEYTRAAAAYDALCDAEEEECDCEEGCCCGNCDCE